MKKVFLIFVTTSGQKPNFSSFFSTVFATAELAQEYCDYLRKHSQHKNAEYHVISTNMYFQKPYVDELCKTSSL